ncbi:MAG TPA: HTTM domain-containing protein, partial [Brevibacterium sp.]|nr:HTTM domain-containing protein [Brevibacterium sp.]
MNRKTPAKPTASVGTRILRAAGSLLLQLWRTVTGVVTDVYFFSENWLLDQKHAQYGLAVTRIVIGFVGIGLLLTNFNARLYTFGEGSAWNGELAQPISDFPNIWLFSLFHTVADNPALFTLFYILL